MARGSSSSWIGTCGALALCASACVDKSAPSAAPRPSATESTESVDLSSAPQRGGRSGMSYSVEQEAALDESPSLADVLRVQNPEAVPDGVAATSRLRRLTTPEYQSTLADLLGLPLSDVQLEFPEEVATLDGYFALGNLRMSDRLIAEVQQAAERLAALVVADPASVARVVGCDPAEAACSEQFIGSFGRRAYRRPLDAAETERYRALFAVASGEGALGGVQAVIEAMLQSPHLLYRVERGRGVSDALGEQITDYEAATRLSYLLRGRGPDDELLDAAEAGELSTPAGVAEQARRLLEDPAVAARVNDFHARWLRMESLSATSKDAAVFPEFSPALLASMRAETERFIEQTALEGDGAVTALLTAPYGFVDARLAGLYGLSGSFGSELARVEFGADSPRGGLLTQASFLSGHSSASRQTSPILRGVFVLRRLLCQEIPDPPPNAQSMEPEEAPEVPLVTTRDYFEWKTSMDACRGCHDRINPVGFAFEDFDAIGRHRDQEEGAAIDATSTVNLAGTLLQIDGGKELAAAIAARPETLACYARNWLRYLWGRADTEADLRTLTRLRQRLTAPDYGVGDLLVDVTQSAAFLHLAPLEGE